MEALKIPLSDSLTIYDCLGALLSHHRAVYRMKKDEEIFVYLGVDEVNELIKPLDEVGQADISYLRALGKAVKGLLLPNAFVCTLLAGTNSMDLKESYLGSGVDPCNLRMTRMSEEAIYDMLITDVGISENYLNNPAFRELLRDIGPVMRPIGIAISHLECDFDPRSIANARSAVQQYLNIRRKGLNKEETKALLGFVLTGRPADPADPICSSSKITLDFLQNSGTVHLIPSQDQTVVFMPRIMLESFLASTISLGYIGESARRLLSFVDSHSPDSFEKFAAHFHAMKRAVLLEQCEEGTVREQSIPIASFFAGALLGEEVVKQEFLLSPLPPSVAFPDGVMWRQGARYPDSNESAEVTNRLKRHGVILNSKGAAVDVLSCEKIRYIGDLLWRDGITAHAVKHTITDEELSVDDVAADCDKAVKAIKASTNHCDAQIIILHFSNRRLSPEIEDVSKWKPEWKRSIIVGENNIEGVVGPMFGRIICSKGFYAIPGSKSYSTLTKGVSARALGRILHLVR